MVLGDVSEVVEGFVDGGFAQVAGGDFHGAEFFADVPEVYPDFLDNFFAEVRHFDQPSDELGKRSVVVVVEAFEGAPVPLGELLEDVLFVR